MGILENRSYIRRNFKQKLLVYKHRKDSNKNYKLLFKIKKLTFKMKYCTNVIFLPI